MKGTDQAPPIVALLHSGRKCPELRLLLCTLCTLAAGLAAAGAPWGPAPMSPRPDSTSELLGCAWILQVDAHDLLPADGQLNAALVEHAASLANASKLFFDSFDWRMQIPSTGPQVSACAKRTNAFYKYQHAHLHETAMGDASGRRDPAYSTLQELFLRGAVRWVQQASGGAIAESEPSARRLFQSAESVFAWFSYLSGDECHPEHHHVRPEALRVPVCPLPPSECPALMIASDCLGLPLIASDCLLLPLIASDRL